MTGSLQIRRLPILIAAFAALCAVSECSAQEITIVPRNPSPVAAPQGAVDARQILQARAYAQVYDSITFLSGLHDFHPLYRHEVTMRILFGEAGCCCDCARRAGEQAPPPGKQPQPEPAFPRKSGQ